MQALSEPLEGYLRRRYVEDGLTDRQIATELGVHYSSVCRRRARLGIAARPPRLGGGSLASRLWAAVEKSEGCWVWTAARLRSGYGVMQVDGRVQRVHRVSYALAFGPIPDGLLVCHSCDNPPCVRPDHLFLGAHADNMADMRAKGRRRRAGVGAV